MAEFCYILKEEQNISKALDIIIFFLLIWSLNSFLNEERFEMISTQMGEKLDRGKTNTRRKIIFKLITLGASRKSPLVSPSYRAEDAGRWKRVLEPIQGALMRFSHFPQQHCFSEEQANQLGATAVDLWPQASHIFSTVYFFSVKWQCSISSHLHTNDCLHGCKAPLH